MFQTLSTSEWVISYLANFIDSRWCTVIIHNLFIRNITLPFPSSREKRTPEHKGFHGKNVNCLRRISDCAWQMPQKQTSICCHFCSSFYENILIWSVFYKCIRTCRCNFTGIKRFIQEIVASILHVSHANKWRLSESVLILRLEKGMECIYFIRDCQIDMKR